MKGSAWALHGRNLHAGGVFNGFEDLLDDFRMQRRACVERNYHSASAFCVDPMTTLRPQPSEAAFKSMDSASAAAKRGALGMNFRSPW